MQTIRPDLSGSIAGGENCAPVSMPVAVPGDERLVALAVDLPRYPCVINVVNVWVEAYDLRRDRLFS